MIGAASPAPSRRVRRRNGGGEGLDPISPSVKNLEAASGDYHGVMKLAVGAYRYSWELESARKSAGAPAGTPATFADTGTGTCHGAGRGP